MTLRQGSIVWVTVADPADRNAKCRPAVVLTPTDEIQDGEPIVLAAATGTFTKPLPDNQIELPWHADGHPKTGLNKRCVVVCDWLFATDQSAIQRIGGQCPPAVLQRVLAQLPKS